MTYNDLVAGNAYKVESANLLKDYSNTKPEDVGYLLVEVRFVDGGYNCFYWDKSFSYCLFGAKFKSEYLLKSEAMLKENNPVFYAFAESVKHIFGH
ncbi:hypothetical protein GuL6_125 [Buttiauxella phage vB_ButM_GuL6]|nr:hypothetical protein GuL6_125 [Buttiauxella phage vB_ButM_GuL6]